MASFCSKKAIYNKLVLVRFCLCIPGTFSYINSYLSKLAFRFHKNIRVTLHWHGNDFAKNCFYFWENHKVVIFITEEKLWQLFKLKFVFFQLLESNRVVREISISSNKHIWRNVFCRGLLWRWLLKCIP